MFIVERAASLSESTPTWLCKDRVHCSPRLDVDALLHEGAEREPERVEDGEVVGDRHAATAVLDVPLEGREARHEEEHDTHANVRKDDAHPHLVRQGIHEGEDTGTVLDRLLDHDADAETHERLREVDDLFSS